LSVSSPALLLIDLQKDFLSTPGLTPPAPELVRRAAALLESCRAASVPVIHIWTTVSRERDDRMPHWRRAGRWECVAGTEGHETPAPLRPRAEAVLHKRFFSAFSAPELEPTLGKLGADTLIVAGVHVQGCVRATVVDAYERGFRVWVATDAVGSHEPLHAAVTRRYLETRAATFANCDGLLDRIRRSDGDGAEPGEWIERRSPSDRARLLWRLPAASAAEVSEAAATAAAEGHRWRKQPFAERGVLLERLGALLRDRGETLAEQVALEVGKPVHYARLEVDRAVALLRAAARPAGTEVEATSEAQVRRPPLGTVAQITPWNNPVAIPLGKLAPALAYGNAVVWKPAPAASGIATTIIELLGEAGCPPGLVGLLHGGVETAAELMADPAIDAVTLTGSSQAGYAAQAICSERRIPLQAELGGNNAAIVWHDCDLAAAAPLIAEAGFGAAGQRCTANRRVIVEDACFEDFLVELESATGALQLGDPLEPEVRIGPLVSDAAADRVAAAVERARRYATVRRPAERRPRIDELAARGAYQRPALIICDDPSAEIVQDETFGPVVVLQRAAGFEQALELLNGVSQGLVASLFSSSAERQAAFAEHVQAGILKLNRATADAGIEAPFGGWKSSGVGPPEHGAANRDFYTRTQAVYS
jgi:acyl-CoA reductase-like NAD-dependent aldehyde dehydrogenase/nicotinamidase-related amidase